MRWGYSNRHANGDRAWKIIPRTLKFIAGFVHLFYYLIKIVVLTVRYQIGIKIENQKHPLLFQSQPPLTVKIFIKFVKYAAREYVIPYIQGIYIYSLQLRETASELLTS
jgi:hypothetical protein